MVYSLPPNTQLSTRMALGLLKEYEERKKAAPENNAAAEKKEEEKELNAEKKETGNTDLPSEVCSEYSKILKPGAEYWIANRLGSNSSKLNVIFFGLTDTPEAPYAFKTPPQSEPKIQHRINGNATETQTQVFTDKVFKKVNEDFIDITPVASKKYYIKLNEKEIAVTFNGINKGKYKVTDGTTEYEVDDLYECAEGTSEAGGGSRKRKKSRKRRKSKRRRGKTNKKRKRRK